MSVPEPGTQGTSPVWTMHLPALGRQQESTGLEHACQLMQWSGGVHGLGVLASFGGTVEECCDCYVPPGTSKIGEHKNGTSQCLCPQRKAQQAPTPLAHALRLANESPPYKV